MTATLSEAIEQAKQREAIARWDAGEARLAAELPIRPHPIELSTDVRSCLDGFNRWAESKSARRAPAKPTTVAAFFLDQAALGASAQHLLAQADAIEKLHDKFGLANPVRTAVVREALDLIIKVDPPRSWPSEDKVLFATLDPVIRQIIAERERERDTAVRRAQNKAAKAATNGAATKVVHIEEKGQENGQQTQQQG